MNSIGLILHVVYGFNFKLIYEELGHRTLGFIYADMYSIFLKQYNGFRFSCTMKLIEIENDAPINPLPVLHKQ